MMKYIKIIIVFFSVIMCMVAKAQISNKTINVGIMLPLHNVDGDGRRMTEYYRGILLAIERLKTDGQNFNIHAWNVDINADIRTTLLQQGASDCHIIFGPLYTKQVKDLANFCQSYDIKMVIPFSISGNHVEKYSQIHQVYQSTEDFNATSIEQVVKQFDNYHTVIIDCNDTTSKKGIFTFGLRKQLQAKGRSCNITNLNSSAEMFAKAFSLTKPNLVILNTGRSPELTMALDKLDQLSTDNRNVEITLFGYKEWLMYTKYNKPRYSKYNTFIPTDFYYNESAQTTKALVERYRKMFGEEMSYALPHFAVTGYDHAMYFLGNRRTWLQNPLKFQKVTGGGFKNKAFMFIHYKPSGGIEALNF